jgi:hypothetical protein
MSFRKTAVKKNVPKVDLQAYNVLAAGGYKSGKTRLWKEVIELFYPSEPDAGLLLAWEDGYNTWELESVVDMHNRNWEFFRNTIVPDLVQEAKDGRVSKVIGIDTVDRLIDSASNFIIRKWNSKYGTDYESIQEFNENIKEDNVWVALRTEIWTQIDKLKKAGYGMIWLAWTKEKETTTIDGLKFNSIELMMSNTGKKIFESQAHLICCLHSDVKVLDKEGNEIDENLKTKKGKEVASNFHTTEVNMYFRPSNYINIAGGRFTELPEKVPYSAENFLKVFEDAVKGQLKKTKTDIKNLKEEQAKDREENAQEYIKKEEENKQASEIISQIDAQIEVLIKAKKTSGIANPFKELFNGNAKGYKTSSDINKLTKALEIAKSVE